MPVAATDLKFFLSGGSANTDPDASLGGGISATEIVSDAAQNLFDNVTPTELTDGSVEYRCFYVKNGHATASIDDVRIWVESQTTSPDSSIDIALDPSGVGDGVSPAALLPSPELETVDPGVSFANSPDPVDYDTGLVIGTLAAGQCIPVWVRRTVLAGGSAASDTATIKIQGTPA